MYVNLACSLLLFDIQCVSMCFFSLTGGANKIFGFVVEKQKGEYFQMKGERTTLEWNYGTEVKRF